MKTKPVVLCQAICALLIQSAAAQSDLWIRDDASDVGIEPNNLSAVLYLSDDIWVRRLADPNYDPQPFPTASPTWAPQPHEGPCYRDPKTSSPNYMYVRVRNRGSAASSGNETLHVYWAKASTGLSWPGDWNDHIADPCATGTPRLYGYEVTKPRRNAATVPAAVRNDYVSAVTNIDTSSFVFPDLVTYFDKQNGVHAPLFNSGIHRSLRFLPWHREFVNRYEALLREVKPALTLLYWDWTTDPSPTIVGAAGYMGASSGAVGAPFSSFGLSRNKPSGAPAVTGLSVSYQSMTLLASTTYADFWGNNSFTAGIERPSHDNAHCYIDGTMCTLNAARDPMFFMLHANCDRLWAMWQRQNSANVDRWTPSQAYDASQMAAAITSNLRPWDGTDMFSPWQNQIPSDPNGYVIFKTPTHHSIVYPPIYDDVLLRIPVLAPNESCIIEIPFYPPPATECGSFADPQHLCLLARIEPITSLPAEGAGLWQNVKNHNNIAWRNVTVSDCSIGPFFLIAPGRIGAAGELIRNLRDEPARVTLRFDEIQPGFRSVFEFGHIRLRLEQSLYDAWVRGGQKGQGIEPVGQNEILVLAPGATLNDLLMEKRQVGHLDLALELDRDYREPFGEVYHIDILQYDDRGGDEPVGGQRYAFDFNLLSIVRKGSDWKYLDGGQVPPENWMSPNYDDDKWRTGSAPFGYGRTDVATGLRGGPNGPPTAYFRQSFDLPDPSFYRNLAVNLLQDDGIVVYLNGKEVVRANMPTGAINTATLALAPMTGAAARACRSFDISNDLGLLNQGRNVLAAEVHHARANKVDLTFDLELAGNVPSEPYQPPTIVILQPEHGGLYRANADIPIFADVLDPDGDLAEVRIYADGELVFRADKPPFGAMFPNRGVGGHRVSVEAEDRLGHRSRMESVFSIRSNLVPVVEVTSPSGETFPLGSVVPLKADATDPDGNVVKVEFFVNQHLRFNGPQIFAGEDSQSPYDAGVGNLQPGHYMVLAVATDNLGARGYSVSGHFMIARPPNSPDITVNFDSYGGRPVITLLWDNHSAVLERAPAITGPWEPVPDAPSSYALEPQRGAQEFYRLHFPHTGHVH